MPRQLEDADDWDDGCDSHGCNCHGRGHGDSDDWNGEDDEGESTVPCPYCGKEMYEDSPRCPHCGQYISDEDAPPRRALWWIIVGVVLCLCAVVVWIITS